MHKTGAAPLITDPVKGKRVYKPISNADVLVLKPDSTSDIFYARCKNAGDVRTISVDMI